jgi:hypothetical protein
LGATGQDAPCGGADSRFARRGERESGAVMEFSELAKVAAIGAEKRWDGTN